MRLVIDDGGREAAGYKGTTGDCVVRAIAIATCTPYGDVYAALFERARVFKKTSRARRAKRSGSPREGVYRDVYGPYLAELGWEWTPTMGIGTGCRVHLRADELPGGWLIVRVSKHLCAVLDGVLYDKEKQDRGGTRCVYGYYSQKDNSDSER